MSTRRRIRLNVTCVMFFSQCWNVMSCLPHQTEHISISGPQTWSKDQLNIISSKPIYYHLRPPPIASLPILLLFSHPQLLPFLFSSLCSPSFHIIFLCPWLNAPVFFFLFSVLFSPLCSSVQPCLSVSILTPPTPPLHSPAPVCACVSVCPRLYLSRNRCFIIVN